MRHRAFHKMNENRHERLATFGMVFALMGICACGPARIVPGPPHDVAKSASDAWVSAGHSCEMKGDLAYCDMSAATLPLIIGYGAGRQLLFGTVFDTQSLGHACETVQFDRVMRPEWMAVRCDEIALADGNKKTVLSIVGGGGLLPSGMTAPELVHAATLFLQEAEDFLVRLRTQIGSSRGDAPRQE